MVQIFTAEPCILLKLLLLSYICFVSLELKFVLYCLLSFLSTYQFINALSQLPEISPCMLTHPTSCPPHLLENIFLIVFCPIPTCNTVPVFHSYISGFPSSLTRTLLCLSLEAGLILRSCLFFFLVWPLVFMEYFLQQLPHKG